MLLNLSQLDQTRYSWQPLLSYKRIMSIVVGERRVGKTFRIACGCVKEALEKHDMTFMWLRITKKEIEGASALFFEDIMRFNVFPDYKFETVGSFGYAINQSTKDRFAICYFGFIKDASNIKGFALPSITKVILDEFMQEKGSIICKYEDELLHSILFSVFSLRKIHCICIGNACTILNPILVHYHIKNIDRAFTKTKECVVENTNYEPIYNKFRKNARDSDFGKIIKGTDYEKYALNNEFALDDTDGVLPYKTTTEPLLAIQLEGGLINVYDEKDLMYFKKVKKTNALSVTPFTKFAKDDTIYMTYNDKLFKKIFTISTKKPCMYSDLSSKNDILLLRDKALHTLNT